MNNIACLLLFALVGFARAKFHLMDEARFLTDQTVVNLGRAPPSARHEIVFALKPNEDSRLAISEKLVEISDPTSENYRRYLTSHEVASLSVSSISTTYVEAFLSSIAGIRIVRKSRYSEYFVVDAEIRVLEHLFDTEFFVFRSTSSTSSSSTENTIAIRSLTLSLPTEAAVHIASVFNTIQHPFAVNQFRLTVDSILSPQSMSQEQLQVVNESSTPPTGELNTQAWIVGFAYPRLIKEHYDVFLPTGQGLASQAVFATIDESFSDEDLALFQKSFGLPIEKPVRTVGGHELTGQCPQPIKCLEANLDVQYIMATAPQVPTTFWYEKDTSSSSFTLFLVDVADEEIPPAVVSISYAMPEAALNYFDKYFFDLEAQKLALRGVTILAASGDQGVSDGRTARTCGYNPSFPASSPYVLAVGATQGPETGSAETACLADAGGGITTGGGFSNLYSTPSWQHEAIGTYFDQVFQSESTKPFVSNSQASPGFQYPNPMFNRNGRGFPDISAMGSRYIVVVNATYYIVSGTSASTPVVAGMLSLINAERVRAGKPTVGYINPLLYAAASRASDAPSSDVPNGLSGAPTTDITSGTYACCCYVFVRLNPLLRCFPCPMPASCCLLPIHS